MKNLEKIIYSICFKDIQYVAQKSFGKILTNEELKIIEEKIGDYFNWYETLEFVIEGSLGLEKAEDYQTTNFDDEY
jgi:hypothetical protein